MIVRAVFIAGLCIGITGLAGCATSPSQDTADADAVVEPSSVEELVRSGDSAARGEDYELALTQYLLAIDSQETPDPEIWFRVGAVCSHTGKSQQALQAYLQVIALDPDHVGGQEGAGLEYMELQAMDQARPFLIAATTLDPRRWRAQNALGILADRDGDYAAAIGYYEAALAINPNSPMILNNLGYSRYLSGDLDQSARDFYRATEIRSDYVPAWSNLGRVYARQGWYGDAVNILSRATDEASAYNHVGYIALQNGDFANAEQLLNEAVRLSPTYYESAYENLEILRSRRRSESLPSSSDSPNLSAAPSTRQKVAATGEMRTVTTAGLNVRDAGTVDSEVIGFLKSGDRVEVLRDSDGWSYVSYLRERDSDHAYGWVRTRYLAADTLLGES